MVLQKIAGTYDMIVDTMKVWQDHVHLFLKTPSSFLPLASCTFSRARHPRSVFVSLPGSGRSCGAGSCGAMSAYIISSSHLEGKCEQGQVFEAPTCPTRAFSQTGAAAPVLPRSFRRRWRRSSVRSPRRPPRTRCRAPPPPSPRAAVSRRTCFRPSP